ncbi:hypothetical protein [Methanococcoides methylutens]|nr:hypothetical protein [Methanococcoides methylutens]
MVSVGDILPVLRVNNILELVTYIFPLLLKICIVVSGNKEQQRKTY